ncbi:unnamed protein product [Coffea canephora]|uniref:Nudix hydrolase domain-containing protein n=2 Tax=Coffea TaxID=13442 RepID=A0A068TQL4_COFCA|nr:nudix hydrolase 17, mitochondrial-like [Coffea arabica]CDO98317.1 unnamed protein product [Coffea canephora]
MQIKKLVSMPSRTGRDLQRYNFEGCRQVVGCIPYRFRKTHRAAPVHGKLSSELEFLLISSQKSPRMMFPKGGWELDETIEQAAMRETMEEAGVLGHVEDNLGVWTFKSKSQDASHEGHMLAFRVTEELDCWPEKDVRQRIWLSANEARILCAHEWMKEALDCFLSKQENAREERTPSLSDLLRNEEPKFGRPALSGQNEDINCSFGQLTFLQGTEDECCIRMIFNLPLPPCSTEESRIGRIAQIGDEDVDRGVTLLV